MKGLLIKDLAFWYQQRKFLVMMVFLAVVLSIVTGSATFAVNYCMIIGLILSMSIFTTDELENGYVFIFSLPITRQMYVKARYMYAICLIILSWFIGSVLSSAINFFIVKENIWTLLGEGLALVPAYLICLAIMLPIIVRYGSQKGRLLLFIVLGFIAWTATAVVPFVLKHFETVIYEVPWALYVVVLVIAAIILYAFSYYLSLVFIEKREF